MSGANQRRNALAGIDWSAIGKVVAYIVFTLVSGAAAGAWHSRGQVADLHEQIQQNAGEINHHVERIDGLKAEFEKEADLRRQTEEAHWQALNQRLDGMDRRLDETHQDVRDLRREVKGAGATNQQAKNNHGDE